VLTLNYNDHSSCNVDFETSRLIAYDNPIYMH